MSVSIYARQVKPLDGESLHCQPVNPRTSQPPSRLANAYPIPLKNQNQAMISFQRMPLEKADLTLVKKWIDLMEENLTQSEQPPV